MRPEKDSTPHAGPAVVFVAAIVAVMLVFALAGSFYFRPAPLNRNVLPLGGSVRVSLGRVAPEETMARVLELVSPTVAVMTVAEEGRSGSGVVVHEAGFIITNAHVVRGVRTLTVSFENGLDLEGEVYGVDRRTDLAVVKVEHTKPLAVAALGDSDSLQVGEFVLALGAPFGLRATATSGIISGLHKKGLGIARYEDFIVTDAPINRGNSGGPLVNLRGEVIGINTAIIVGDENDRGGGFSGIGFAIPMNLVKVIAQRLIGDGGLEADADEVLVAPEDTAALVSGGRVKLTGLLHGGQSAANAVGFVRVLGTAGNAVRTGSGFVVDSEIGQLLITNQHVTAGETVVEVDFPGHSGIPGLVIHESGVLDLAIIRLMEPPGMPALMLGASVDLAVRDAVKALGARAPGGVVELDGRVTELNVGNTLAAPGTRLIATSAATVLGDSGGPLLDDAGHVVGVIVARASRSDASGRRPSYAVPVGDLMEVLEDAVSTYDEDPTPAFDHGLEGFYETGEGAKLRYSLEGQGLRITSVAEGGVGEAAGFRRGDVIAAVNGEPITDIATWWRDLRTALPGSVFAITVMRAVEDGGDTGYRSHRITLRVPDVSTPSMERQAYSSL